MTLYYKIIECFEPNSEKWPAYINWRKTNLTSFDSVDGMLRPDLFLPKSAEDWANCVNEDLKLHLITNLDYAKEIINHYPKGNIVGVEPEINDDHICKKGFSGYDIIDGDWYVSLIANWGTDGDNSYDRYLMGNGLIGDLNQALQVCDLLQNKFPDDQHAKRCTVWAIYRIDV